jgi:eukaryotic-like serine/threonine-protein kinase
VGTTVKSDQNDAPSTTASAIVSVCASEDGVPPASGASSPSTAEPTHTSDHDRPVRTTPPASATLTAQFRDPTRYHILGEHGRGGLGRVSRARDVELGRDVAIKELISRGHVSEVRFLREALITARLEHPGIVPVHEAGRWPDGIPFYAMKLVAGRPLRNLISERNTVDDRIGLLHHVIAVADAIAYAHGCNIIHRDLKPSNVIVGDFGETVVIDWGLAKDLTADEDSPVGGPFCASGDNSLTSTGTVLGTPAYMAPEQARGEPVDQRADVYAIGAMLWELCSLQKLPPNYTGQRRRILRRGRIGGDLVTIIDKALQPDPANRYPDAAALAADLKAFKAGARISARRYSLWALLAHWTQRHRALAVAATTALLLAATGVALYTRNIAVERDRADAEAHRAQAQEQAAEQATSDLLLQHAETLMRVDPTAAAAILEKYRGSDTMQLRRLQAEARDRGLPIATFRPHSSAILFLTADSQGAVYSIAFDGKLRITDRTGSMTLASNVSTTAQFGYASTPRLLAYKTVPAGLAVLALSTRTTTTLDAQDIADVKIAADGSHLATLGSDGLLKIWSLTPSVKVLHREPIPGATQLAFTTPTEIVIKTPSMLLTRSFASSRYIRKAIPLPARMFGTAPQRIVAGDEYGNIYILSTELTLLASSSVCQQGITDVQAFERHDLMAFGCAEGAAGIAHFDPKTGRVIVVDRFRMSGAAHFALPDEAEERVVAASYDSNQIYIYDVATRMVSEYQGRPGINRLFPGARGYNRILVGDVQGVVQAWDPPSRAARVLLRGGGPIYHVMFSPRGQTLVTDGDDHVARKIDLTDGTITELRGHTGSIVGIKFSPDGRMIVTVSADRTLRVWRASDGGLIREFNEHRNAIRDLGFFDNEQRAASIDENGRLLSWSLDHPDFSVLYESAVPLLTLAMLHRNNHVIVQDATSSLWDISPNGKARQRRHADGVINDLRMTPDSRMLAIGTDTGNVIVYETDNWTTVATADNQGPIRRLAFEPRGRALAIASENGKVHIMPLGAAGAMRWRDIQVAAHSLAYAPDGELLAISCDDGSTWFYDVRRDVWVYTRDHDVESFGAFSLDGRHFASADRKGVVVLRDTEATFTKAIHP